MADSILTTFTMISRPYTTTILLIALTIHQFMSIAGDYKGIPLVRTYMPKEYGAGMQNSDLSQDNRGIIYLANNYGLLEYDGTNWQTYPVSNGTKVRSIAIHSTGRIYVSAQNQFGYFFPDGSGSLSYHSLSDDLDEQYQELDEVWKTHIIGNTVYFATTEYIFIYRFNQPKIIKPESSIINTYLVGSRIYVQLDNSGLSFIENDELVPLIGSDGMSDKVVTGLIPITRDHLLVATENAGIYKYTGNTMEPWNTPANKVLKSTRISLMKQLSGNRIAVGTHNSGLYILSADGKVLYHHDSSRGFNDRDILGLMEDDYGNIWVGQNNGLAKIESSSPFTYINEEYGVQGAGYCSYPTNEGVLMGTNNGLFLFERNINNTVSHYSSRKLAEGQVYSITELNNSIFIGHNNTAMIMKNNQIKKLADVYGAWKFMIPRSRQNILLQGGYTGFELYTKENGNWNHHGYIKGLEESSRVFEEELDGTIWMTHGYKGVYKLEPSEDYKSFKNVKYYGEEDGFATNQLINVFHVNNEFVFCTGQGIYAYSKQTDRFHLHKQFTQLLGPEIHVREMEEDPYGNIYFIAKNFCGVLKKDRFGKFSLETQIFNKIRTQLNDDLEDISVVGFNEVLFGAYQGFIHYDAKQPTNLLNPINILIRKITSTNVDSVLFSGSFSDEGIITMNQPSNQSPEYKFAYNSISFEFSSTFADEDTEYRYFLKGFDKDWSDWQPSTEKEYTNLREGKYEFMVQAKNIYDVVSEQSTYRFIILPPWYRTRVAYLSYILLGFMFIGGALLWQGLRHKYEKKAMTIKQQRELIRKDHEFEQMSEKSNAEIMRLQNEKLELDINSKNKELASSTMNLIDKNQLLTGLKDELMNIINSDKKNGSNKLIKDMIKKIEKNISSDDEWEHFQQYFDQVHGDFTQRLRSKYTNLTPQEVKLSNYLRMNLSTKEIAQLMNITTRGVEIARYRLRKKLELDRTDNLTEFIARF
ncbi:triple tyrosine motif-containing protein [Marinoscillum sp. MHG1-6]|uniref:triple tyrosine motif-containing protein n=1 Tax=Marinoscillum sp. MHG1-6 TaxID=2959627 RepID=UPI00215773E6|nr:triple tyrosine motif-containing protein [Marinoscillum sp. MHG1-6]